MFEINYVPLEHERHGWAQWILPHRSASRHIQNLWQSWDDDTTWTHVHRATFAVPAHVYVCKVEVGIGKGQQERKGVQRNVRGNLHLRVCQICHIDEVSQSRAHMCACGVCGQIQQRAGDYASGVPHEQPHGE